MMTSCSRSITLTSLEVSTAREDLLEDGSPYTPSTQSFLRYNHWLEGVDTLDITIDKNMKSRVRFHDIEDPDASFELANYPLDYLLPRLNYPVDGEADAFDAFNLMLAEYSRNSVSVPIGKKGDSMAHYKSNFEDGFPWYLGKEDYTLIPNKKFRPFRVSMVNNCLFPGLWELSATDRAGELHHSWFRFPKDTYYQLVGELNGLDPAFVKKAVAWDASDVAVNLDRLRQLDRKVGDVELGVNKSVAVGYSSQDSRRKISKGYVLVEEDGELKRPKKILDLLEKPAHLSEFISPGKYSMSKRRRFDFSYLTRTDNAEVFLVHPKTHYNWRKSDRSSIKTPYVEIHLKLQDYAIIIGNLPLSLLVPQEDFAINGFGVGVLSSGGLAERRRFLLTEGPAPSFAYLCHRGKTKELIALNSHEMGLEQVFLRTHIEGDKMWWEVTITSYERMADIVKYRVEIPGELKTQVQRYQRLYIPPVFFTYRDDNLR
jgi:hypothetical protein